MIPEKAQENPSTTPISADRGRYQARRSQKLGLARQTISYAGIAQRFPNRHTHEQEVVMRILRRRQVLEKVGYSAMHLWRLERAGLFPRSIRLGPNSVGYVAKEIDAWIEEKIAARNAGQGQQSATRPTPPTIDVKHPAG